MNPILRSVFISPVPVLDKYRMFGRTKSESNRLLGGDGAAEDDDHRIVIVKTKPYRDSTELQKL